LLGRRTTTYCSTSRAPIGSRMHSMDPFLRDPNKNTYTRFLQKSPWSDRGLTVNLSAVRPGKARARGEPRARRGEGLATPKTREWRMNPAETHPPTGGLGGFLHFFNALLCVCRQGSSKTPKRAFTKKRGRARSESANTHYRSHLTRWASTSRRASISRK
jgi:hypothetical protein